MKRVVTTTITSLIDVDTSEVTHSVQVTDHDQQVEIPEVFGNVLRGAAGALFNQAMAAFPIPAEEPEVKQPQDRKPPAKKRAPAKKAAASKVTPIKKAGSR